MPEGLDTAIEVLVTATDQDGNEVTTSFKIGDIQPTNEPGNDEQSELQLLLKHKRKLALIEGVFEGHPGFGEQLASASRLGPGPSQSLISNSYRALQITGLIILKLHIYMEENLPQVRSMILLGTQ